MDEEHLRKLDELYKQGKLEKKEHEKKFGYEKTKLLGILNLLNEIDPQDPDHKQVTDLSWEVMDMLGKIRREEATNIFPTLKKCKDYFDQRRLKHSKKYAE